MHLADLLNLGAAKLHGAGIAEYELDARLLLEFCTGKSRTEIYLHGQSEVTPEIQDIYLGLVARRRKREPMGHIRGEQEFWSLPFYVSPDVLIPRPETEFLLDRVLALCDRENMQDSRIVDLCCGSGVIATVLARETGKMIVASDISYKALQMTRQNLIRHRLLAQVTLVQGHLLTPFSAEGKVSLLVSNPPYVSSVDVAGNLMPEVADYEPHLALDGGAEGLEYIKEIRFGLPRLLCPGGQCFVEIGADQGETVKKLFQQQSGGQTDFQQVEILVDYAGRNRVLYARRGK